MDVLPILPDIEPIPTLPQADVGDEPLDTWELGGQEALLVTRANELQDVLKETALALPDLHAYQAIVRKLACFVATARRVLPSGTYGVASELINLAGHCAAAARVRVMIVRAGELSIDQLCDLLFKNLYVQTLVARGTVAYQSIVNEMHAHSVADVYHRMGQQISQVVRDAVDLAGCLQHVSDSLRLAIEYEGLRVGQLEPGGYDVLYEECVRFVRFYGLKVIAAHMLHRGYPEPKTEDAAASLLFRAHSPYQAEKHIRDEIHIRFLTITQPEKVKQWVDSDPEVAEHVRRQVKKFAEIDLDQIEDHVSRCIQRMVSSRTRDRPVTASFSVWHPPPGDALTIPLITDRLRGALAVCFEARSVAIDPILSKHVARLTGPVLRKYAKEMSSLTRRLYQVEIERKNDMQTLTHYLDEGPVCVQMESLADFLLNEHAPTEPLRTPL